MSNERRGLISAGPARQFEQLKAIINTFGISKLEDGYASLLFAIKSRLAGLVQLLLTNGCKVNIENNQSMNTPLHLAVKNKDINIVEMLLHKSADVNARGEYGQTPLHTAISGLKVPATFFACWTLEKPLLRKGNVTSINIIKLLLKSGANVNAQTRNGLTPLYIAIEKQCTDVVKLLLHYNAHVHNDKHTGTHLLFMAVDNESLNITNMLLRKGINVNVTQNGMSAVHAACSNSQEILLNVMEQHLAYESRDGRPLPLYLCGKAGQEQMIEILWKYGADMNMNMKDTTGRTALHLASLLGLDEHIKNLLAYGADINIISNDNRTALDEAIRSDRPLTAKILKQHILKRKAANLYVIRKNLRSARTNDLKEFYGHCKREVERMKMKTICKGRKASFYNIVTKGIKHWTMYAGNENVKRVLQSGGYKQEFPIYASMIDNNFKRGLKRQVLINPSTKSLNLLLRRELPQLVINELFTYLNHYDLQNLTKAGRYTNC